MTQRLHLALFVVSMLFAAATVSCQHSATVDGYAHVTPVLSMRSIRVGQTIGTCSFRIHRDGTVWLFDYQFSDEDACIKVRREQDGWVAILSKEKHYSVIEPPFAAGWMSGETPVKRVEYQ